MFKKIDIPGTLIAAATAAVLFSTFAALFLWNGSYTYSWLLYMGSFLFGITMWIHTVRDNKKRGENESTIALVFSSHVCTIAGVLISCLLSFILLVIFVPGYLGQGMADYQQVNEPANTIHDKTDGLSFQVFIAATIINFSVGSFVGIILPFYTKRNQKRDSREPTPLHQRGTK